MNTSGLDGCVAVVIGGASGVGRGVVLGLLVEGMRVVVADIDLDGARTVVEEAARRGAGPDRVFPAVVDSTDRHGLEALADAVTSRFGAINVLVNTVGVVFDGPLASATDEDWFWTFELNVLSQVRAVQVFLPHLRAADGLRHIVTTASTAGVSAAPPANGLYAATKHALVAYSERLRSELASEAIGVSVLCPSRVVGNLAETSARERLRRLGRATPDGWGAPPDTRDRVPAESLGPLVAAAIHANRFFICNRPDALLAACEERRRQIRDDLEYLAPIPSE
jgi:NAD(P)-dependent dehydrogenase (short-subunit alcohol dehydrogenase family)